MSGAVESILEAVIFVMFFVLSLGDQVKMAVKFPVYKSS